MATTTTVAGAQAKIAFAQNVLLQVGGTSPADFTLMRNVEFGFTRPETRYAHGLTRTYGHGPPDAEITFTVSANAGAYAYIMAKSDRSTAAPTSGGTQYGKPTRGVVNEEEWTIKLVGDDGQSEVLKMKGKLRDVTMRKPDGDNSEVVDLDCFVRVTDETIEVTNSGG